MDPQAIGNWLSGEIAVASHAVFWAAVIVAAILIWRAMEWRYGGIIAKLKEEKAAPAVAAPKPASGDDRWRILEKLRQARGSITVALYQGDAFQYARALNEAEAVMLTVKSRFGIGPMEQVDEIVEKLGRKAALQAYGAYIDTFYALLKEGHSDLAKEKAAAFSWRV